ncbi:MAG: hypothetical protein IH995_07930 [Proteobacteria bacterium]|nr:hypothetical protein [Pseudomonadota bacterium]
MEISAAPLKADFNHIQKKVFCMKFCSRFLAIIAALFIAACSQEIFYGCGARLKIMPGRKANKSKEKPT